MQYNWFKNRINGDELPEEKYNSDGITLSAEAGYSFLINETQGSDGSTNRWFIQPKAQVTYMGVKMDTHTERAVPAYRRPVKGIFRPVSG